MGWKGAVRSVGAVVRAVERDSKRRRRELERQQKQYEKMLELEQAEYEVEVYGKNWSEKIIVVRPFSSCLDLSLSIIC